MNKRQKKKKFKKERESLPIIFADLKEMKWIFGNTTKNAHTTIVIPGAYGRSIKSNKNDKAIRIRKNSTS
ncbi:hypothetical protein P9B97_02365 [Bacillus paralicheniformis]|uniref:hypothetical protein n=1 Tax=Bacillus paralicheniformis TaxID=1648923 RepID=UPI002DBC8006|nr:hypothetical protein [Bacillus paralicheniformis]MEC1050926.1 hypothetical protein [Bacillus paralicheniformis]MEC1085042.1 hypothetical protein [Bacillus paralicheniformis]MEC1108842.1 hypothetical protein [Bacillus paralicheniformis]MEC1137180.1 hypothetical protein [Bacillus paralicheniformis]MEC1148065.1 hypothetical protein [Bacillus paralicheniformis]